MVASSFASLNYGMIWLGDGGWQGGGETQTSLDKVPGDIVLDRVYVHGQTTTNSQRCIAMQSARTAIVNSWISDCHAKGFDSQAIAGWNGPGPYLIENNVLSGAGENVMFGGADPTIANLVPSDITIRRNHIYKEPSWKGVWTVKNLFELKTGRRVLVEGNIIENNWADAQTGMAIVIKSANDGGTAPWQGTTDLTFRYNIVRNSPQGFNVAASPDISYGGPVVPVARVRAEHNLFENIGNYNGTTGGRMVILMNALTDVAIEHNTMVMNNPGLSLIMEVTPTGGARNIVMNDNITSGGQDYAVFHSGMQVGTASLTAYATTAWAFNRNVIPNVDPQFVAWHPQASWYPTTSAGIGFVDAANGNYRLSSSSPYKGRGAGGTDPGADLDNLARRASGVKLGGAFVASASRIIR
jgi:polygalacturonase